MFEFDARPDWLCILNGRFREPNNAGGHNKPRTPEERAKDRERYRQKKAVQSPIQYSPPPWRQGGRS